MSQALKIDSAGEVLLVLHKIISSAAIDDITVIILLTLGTVIYALRGIVWDKPNPYYHLWFERPQGDGVSSAGSDESRNIAHVLDETGKKAVVFWGSQSGTAEGFANRFVRECQNRFGLAAMSADLSDFDCETIALLSKDHIVIFILSTYGEGDPPDNTGALCEWLSHPSDNGLPNLHYMAFGLGNKSYKHYNKVVDVVTEALDKQGASALMPVGKADDSNGGTEEDFMAWKEASFKVLAAQLHLEEREQKYEPNISIRWPEDNCAEMHVGVPSWRSEVGKVAASYSPIRPVPIKSCRELFPSSERKCLHIELDITDFPEIVYKTGDHLAVWPINPDVEVDRLLELLGLQETRRKALEIECLDPSQKTKIPTPTTIEALFRYYIGICGPVSRDTILSLCQFAPSETAKSFLIDLARDKDAYISLQKTTHLNLGRLLQLANQESQESNSWATLPLSFILETLPPLLPRYYSISSSSVTSPRHPTITAVVSTTKLEGSSSDLTEGANLQASYIFGLTTNYLLALTGSLQAATPMAHPQGLTYPLTGPSSLLEGGKVHALIRRSKFKLPLSPARPLLLVAAGTGIAPFRAFIQERARLHAMGKIVGRILLVFGCRRRDEDFLYHDELKELQTALGTKLEIYTAFSREGEGTKVYVQDVLIQRKQEVAKLLLEEEANLYICGAAGMAREVGKAVSELIIESNQGWGEEKAQEWVETRKKSNRWQEDVW